MVGTFLGRLGLALVVLAFMAGACGDDDDGGGGDATEEPAETQETDATEEVDATEPGEPPEFDGQIKIGFLASLTGFCAALEEGTVFGAELAVEEINRAGGVLGKELVLEVRDDQALPEVGVQQARDLVLSEDVKFLAGTCSSAIALAISQQVAEPNGVFYLSATGSSRTFQDFGNDFVFGALTTTDVEGRSAAQFVANHPEWERVAFIGEDSEYNRQNEQAFRDGIEELGLGVEVVASEFTQFGEPDYTPFITKILSEDPDFVWNNLIAGDEVGFIRQAGPLGFFEQTDMLFFGHHLAFTAFEAGEIPDGIYAYNYYPEVALYPDDETLRFIEEQAREGLGTATADALVIAGWNEIQLIAQAIEAAGSEDPEEVAALFDGGTWKYAGPGEVTYRECDNLPILPIAIGVASDPTEEFDYIHIAEVELIDTEQLRKTCEEVERLRAES